MPSTIASPSVTALELSFRSALRSAPSLVTAGLVAISLLATGTVLAAEEAQEQATKDAGQAWQVERPAAETREIAIDVTAGTWMSLDVSPAGDTIAFDLLGDIYEVPITGGQARSVSSGMAWEMQPRYSPDGKTLAYISDRDGGDNIWLHSLAENQRRALTKESFRLLNNPSFSPDGRFVVGRKHFTTGRSLGTGGVVALPHCWRQWPATVGPQRQKTPEGARGTRVFAGWGIDLLQ